MKAAITMIPATGRISPMFDAAEHAAVLDCRCRADNGAAVVAPLPPDIPGKIEFFRANGIVLVITGAISNEDIGQLNACGIRVFPFVSGLWRAIWSEWKTARRLSACHLMPGCRGHHRQCCQRKNRHE